MAWFIFLDYCRFACDGAGLPLKGSGFVASRRSLLYSFYFGYFVAGLLLTLVGPIIPHLRDDFGLTFAQVGPIFIAHGIGFSLSVFTGGFISDAIGRRPVLLWGAAVLTLAQCGYLLAHSWWMTLTLFLFTGAGFGLVETALNSITVDLNPDEKGAALNTLHLFPAAGAVAGPYLADWLLTWDWRIAMASVGFLIFLFWIWLLREQFPTSSGSESFDRRDLFSIVRNPLVLTLAVVLSLYVGAELSVSNWSVSLTVDVLGASSLFGASVTALLWIGLVFGRVISSRLVERIGYLRLILISGTCAAIAYAPVLYIDSPRLIALFTFLTGFFFGGIFPTVLAYAGMLFPRRIGAVNGLIIAACSLGGAGIPALIGAAADMFGLQAGLILVVSSAVVMVLAALAASRLTHHSGTHGEIAATQPPQ